MALLGSLKISCTTSADKLILCYSGPVTTLYEMMMLHDAQQAEHQAQDCETIDGEPFVWTTTYHITVDGMKTFRPGTSGNYAGEQVCRLMMEVKRDFYESPVMEGWRMAEPHWDCPFYYQAKRPGCDACWIRDKKLNCHHKTEDEEIRFL